MPIHPTAIVDPAAEIDPDADIGPYVVIEGAVRIGPGTRVYAHAYLAGWTEIGANCQIHPGAVVGHAPQDLKYEGTESYCRIGDETLIRECASVHRGTEPGSATVIGRRCFVMAGAHVGHNSNVADDVILANNAALGGHVSVGARAFLGGAAMVHQFVRIGELVMLGGAAPIGQDVPPYFLTDGTGRCAGTNVVGLRRAGFSAEQRDDAKRAYGILYRCGIPLPKAVEQIMENARTDVGRRIAAFLREPSKRGIASATRGRRREPI